MSGFCRESAKGGRLRPAGLAGHRASREAEPMASAALIAQASEGLNPLGDDLLTWAVLALGAALAVGTLLALVRPPAQQNEGELSRPPLVRSVAMIVLGGVAATWALATLLTS